MEFLLECHDATARLYIGDLLKHIITTLKFRDASQGRLCILETITSTNEKGETTTVQQPASLVARFIMKCLSLLNTQVAKNWSRFDIFFEVLYAFGCAKPSSEGDN
jgi:hypothetical protein